jgi:hypothetical protein
MQIIMSIWKVYAFTIDKNQMQAGRKDASPMSALTLKMSIRFKMSIRYGAIVYVNLSFVGTDTLPKLFTCTLIGTVFAGPLTSAFLSRQVSQPVH